MVLTRNAIPSENQNLTVENLSRIYAFVKKASLNELQLTEKFYEESG